MLSSSLSLPPILVVSTTNVALANPSLTVTVDQVEHVRIVSTKTFARTKATLEGEVPQLDPKIVAALAAGNLKQAQALEHGAPLFIFLKRDHGALLQAEGGARNAVQYDIGNPITASLMTRHRLQAALYAPLRVVLYENADGGATFEYDKPSTLFGQFGDTRVNEVAHKLDDELKLALEHAAK